MKRLIKPNNNVYFDIANIIYFLQNKQP